MCNRLPRYALLAALTCGAAACTDTSARPVEKSEPVSLDAVVRWSDTIPLEESAEVVNVTPKVTADPMGGFVVADSRETQVRLYSPTGDLVHHFASKGHGPAEFQRISAALRLPSGEFLVVDMGGKIAVFDSTGTNVVRTARAPLGPLYEAALVNDTLVAFAGRSPGKASTSLVHLWSLRSDTIVRSFFPVPPAPKDLAGAYAFNGFANIAVRHDTVAVLFALSDTVYLYTIQGQPAGKINIPFKHFRKVQQPMPTNGPLEEFQGWAESFSSASHLFWAADGSFLVQYFDRSNMEPQWRLLRMSRDGQRLFEVRDTPQLLAVADRDPDLSSLYFVQPGSLTPNVWSVAHLAER